MNNTGSSNLCNKCYKPYYDGGSYTIPRDVCRCYERQDEKTMGLTYQALEAQVSALKAENERLKKEVEELKKYPLYQLTVPNPVSVEDLEKVIEPLVNELFETNDTIQTKDFVDTIQTFISCLAQAIQSELRKKVGE
jgi:hypothetical protein